MCHAHWFVMDFRLPEKVYSDSESGFCLDCGRFGGAGELLESILISVITKTSIPTGMADSTISICR